MVTLLFDIDGTLTDMWPIERAVLLAMPPGPSAVRLHKARVMGVKNLRQLYMRATGLTIATAAFRDLYRETFLRLASMQLLPAPKPYRAAKFISKNGSSYACAYVTGGLRAEAEYVLASLELTGYFDTESSVSRDTCRFAKPTGIPFRQLQKRFGNCVVVTDGGGDVLGASRANLPVIQLAPNQKLTRGMLVRARREVNLLP